VTGPDWHTCKANNNGIARSMAIAPVAGIAAAAGAAYKTMKGGELSIPVIAEECLAYTI